MKSITFFRISIIIMIIIGAFSVKTGEFYLAIMSFIMLLLCIKRYNSEIEIEIKTAKWIDQYYCLFNSDIGKNYLGDPKESWRVVTAAHRDRETGLIIVGARHFDSIIRAQMFALSGTPHIVAADFQNTDSPNYLSLDSKWKFSDQGFIDNYGDFLTRAEAYIVAKHADQFTNQWKTHESDGFLYSENIH